MISRKEKLLLAVASVLLSTGLTWYASGGLGPTTGDMLLIGAMSFLMWAGLISTLRESDAYQPVLAPVLERLLLTPLKENQQAQWREEGRAQERAEIHARLETLGLDPSKILADRQQPNGQEGN